jgi:hypothetical protein
MRSEFERVTAKIAEVEAKLAATKDAASRRYYELCLEGWVRWLEKVKEQDYVATNSEYVEPTDL